MKTLATVLAGRRALVAWLAVLFVGPAAFAGEYPYGLTFAPTYINYYSFGSYHQSQTLADFGMVADFSYPINPTLRVKAIAVLAPGTGFEFFGIGCGLDFAPSSVHHRQEGDSIEITSYRKWRPFIDAFVGYNDAQTQLAVGTLNEAVSEELWGALGRAGVGYAFSPVWELDSYLWGIYTISSDVTVMGFGVGVGVKLNMF